MQMRTKDADSKSVKSIMDSKVRRAESGKQLQQVDSSLWTSGI
jgi:hypothetical protein